MDHRALVRPRSLVTAATSSLVALSLLATAAPAQPPQTAPAATAAALPPLELRPYQVRVLVAADPSLRLDDDAQARLLAAWRDLVGRFVGSPWRLETQPAQGPLADADLDALAPSDLLPYAEGCDQLWYLRIGPREPAGFELTARCLDTVTSQLGPVRARTATHEMDAARQLLALSLQLFTPRAEIGAGEVGQIRITVQGASLGAASPLGQVVAKGSAFVPVRIFRKPDGSVLKIAPIGWTYLIVDAVEGSTARCSIISSLRDPLTRRVIGKHDLVALGVRPAARPLHFRFETRPPNARPAAGYRLTVRKVPDGSPHTVGMTDRDGRITVPPDPLLDGPMLVRLLAGEAEPLVEFPVMPGETDAERTVRIDPLSDAVAFEARLNSLEDQVVDQVAQRSRLQSLLESRVQGNAWDDVRALLDEYRKLPAKQKFLDQLAALREAAQKSQQDRKIPVITRTAQAQLTETETLISNYLDDEIFQAYERAAQDAAAGGVLLPSTNWKPYLVPGELLNVMLPGPPQRSRDPLPIGAGREPLRLFEHTADDRFYQIGVSSVLSPGTDTAATIRPLLISVRDAILSASRGVRILSQSETARAGMPALDTRIERSGEAGATTQVRILLIRLPDGKVAYLSVAASAELMRAREVDTFLNSPKFERPGAAPSPKPAPTPPPAAPAPAPAPAAKSAVPQRPPATAPF